VLDDRWTLALKVPVNVKGTGVICNITPVTFIFFKSPAFQRGFLFGRYQTFSIFNSTGNEFDTMSYTGEKPASSRKVAGLASLLTFITTRTV
jgi:hypothetical protein